MTSKQPRIRPQGPAELLSHKLPFEIRCTHRPSELLGPSLDLPDPHLQVLNFFLGVLQGGVELLLTGAEAYEMTQVSAPQKHFLRQDRQYDDSTYRWTKH
jgi:hypothetical protein